MKPVPKKRTTRVKGRKPAGAPAHRALPPAHGRVRRVARRHLSDARTARPALRMDRSPHGQALRPRRPGARASRSALAALRLATREPVRKQEPSQARGHPCTKVDTHGLERSDQIAKIPALDGVIASYSVGSPRLERGTSCMSSKCSNQLSYEPRKQF